LNDNGWQRLLLANEHVHVSAAYFIHFSSCARFVDT